MPRARCSPWMAQRRESFLVDERDSRAARAHRQLQVVAHVTGRRRRAALPAARLVAPLPEPSPTAIPWRERPPEMAAWPAKPAASDVVAHATAERVLAPRASTVSPLDTAGAFDAKPARELDGFLDALFTLVPARGSERLTPRGGPRQRAVVGALRERYVSVETDGR